MNERVKDDKGKDTDFTVRQHMEQAAKRSPKVAAELEGPPFPEELRYLYNLLLQLYGRSGVGFSGLAPLSHQEVEACARLRDLVIAPHEVEALMLLDGVMRDPEAGED